MGYVKLMMCPKDTGKKPKKNPSYRGCDELFRTDVKHGEMQPKWFEKFEDKDQKINPKDKKLVFVVMDDDLLGDDAMAEYTWTGESSLVGERGVLMDPKNHKPIIDKKEKK